MEVEEESENPNSSGFTSESEEEEEAGRGTTESWKIWIGCNPEGRSSRGPANSDHLNNVKEGKGENTQLWSTVMSDINKQQQAAVAAHQNAQQQQPAQQAQMQQQQVEGQTIQVQQVASSNASLNSSSTMVMATPQQTLLPQQAMQNLQSPPIAPMPSQGGATTITTMSTGPPQQMADWPGHGRVQVIQQPLQNPTYIQPVYNAQGQLIVPGNIALHPGNMNQPIQVIAAGKAFQPGQMPHMLTTTQGKPIVQGQATSFPGYATIPTSGNNQTLVISQLGVLGQTNILPQQQQQQQQAKPQEMQKMIAKTNVANNGLKGQTNQQQNVSIGSLVSSQTQGITTQAQTIIQPQILSPIQYTCNTQQQRTVPQGATQAMQFAPWQATFGPTGLPQGLTWAPGAIQSSALLTQGSQIFIRNPQQEQTGMFIPAQPSSIPQHNQIGTQQVNKPNQGIEMAGNVQAKTPIPKTFSTILPNSIGPQNIRPASSVSTQTGQTQTTAHQANFQSMKGATKVRTKNVCRMPTMATAQKTDASNQTKSSTSVQVLQPKLVVSNVSPGTPISQDKLLKQVQSPVQQVGNQQQQAQQQTLTQIQQLQNMFPEQMDQKAQPGQVLVSNGIQNAGDRTVMPVVSMPPGQMGSIMGNMIVQTVPGIATMTPGLSIPAGQPVTGVPIAQEIIATPGAVSLGTAIKQENVENKETVQENGGTETGPGRPAEENTSSSEGSVTASEALPKTKTEKAEAAEPEQSSQGKEKSVEDKENKENEKVNEKDGAGLGQAKATMMVKPQVLTHVIEGFVIQESSEPFPVNRGCVDGWIRKMPANDVLESGEPPMKKSLVEGGKERELATCETCGKKDLRSKFKKSKRFCSLSCVKREEDKLNSGGETDANESAGESSLSPTATEGAEAQSLPNQENGNKVNPMQWTVAEVCEFIRNLPGCADYVEDFAMQDIDGEALMLLKPDHLMSVMSMKLGPAVKIIAKIDTMRSDGSNAAA